MIMLPRGVTQFKAILDTQKGSIMVVITHISFLPSFLRFFSHPSSLLPSLASLFSALSLTLIPSLLPRPLPTVFPSFPALALMCPQLPSP